MRNIIPNIVAIGKLAVDELEFYPGEKIPKIGIEFILPQVSNVRFDSDLTEVQPIKKSRSKSLLQKSLL